MRLSLAGPPTKMQTWPRTAVDVIVDDPRSVRDDSLGPRDP
jgi:hypothetical protein